MGLWPKSRQSFIGSFRSAFKGLNFALEGRNFVVTILISIVVLVLSYVFGLTTEDRFVILISAGLVLGAEIFNSALEQILDIIIPHHDEKVGRAKDLLAGGVLIFSLIAVAITIRAFARVLLPYI